MNPHANNSVSPANFSSSLWRHRQLVWQMTQREVIGRYQGSIMGLAWSFFNPILLLAVYTFVFSVIFKARWNVDVSGSNSDYAIILFVGLIVHGLFAEVVNRSPAMIMANANYVKKVVFPLELLPVIALSAALFHAIISTIVLVVAIVGLGGRIEWTVLLFPVVLMPFIIFVLGLSWMLSSVGVFLRDVGQTVGILTMVMMFLAPVVYPISAVPVELQPWLAANPLTLIIQQSREVLVWGRLPDWAGLGLYASFSFAFAWLGFFWFQKTRKGFADVL